MKIEPTLLRKILPITAVLGLGVPTAHAQLFWNPAVDAYATQGGDGDWYQEGAAGAETNWWNGVANVAYTDSDVVFEGQGDVVRAVGSSQRADSVQFRNLTGDYTFEYQVSINTAAGLTVEASAGVHNITMDRDLRVAGGQDSSIINNGAGELILDGGFIRSSGDITSVTISGTGDTVVNSNPGRMGGSLTKEGSGRLTISADLTDSPVPFADVKINDGEFFSDDATAEALTWNDGAMVFSLSESDNTSNTLTLDGGFMKGINASYLFDFQDTGMENTTYTLITFGSTDFTEGDFSYIGASPGGSFRVTGNSLEFIMIPEPSSAGILMGLTFGALAFFRRSSYINRR